MSVATIGRVFRLYSETKFMHPAVRRAAMVQSRFFQRSNGMHKVVIGALVLAALAGCAGSKMKEARAGTPYKTLASDKATLVVAECVQFGWQDESVFGVDAGGFKEPIGAGGFTVYTTAGDYFADVQSAGTGSTINYYAAQDNMPAKRRLAALATCL
ncbi:Uncharacterized protein PFLU_2965 [Pseudomonas [fluorescens] SBW25]|jgi:hypothetical protein|uniref:Lipoprotein n=3 Tax=Pseudomonas fluorescens group TaxID=136843 RepID=C3KB55_PSEFS|nr:Uncharacterized protein PFLU_2965 [Pseudomonas fluorescens SBW25]